MRYFILVLLASFHAHSANLKIHGQELEVQVESYRDSEIGPVPHAVHLKEPRVFEFNNGLKMELKGRVLLHDNGNIWMVAGAATSAPVEFRIGQSTVLLACGERPVIHGITIPPRIIQFYPDGAYRMGCESFAKTRIQSGMMDLELEPRSSVDLNPEGALIYASKIAQGQIDSSFNGKPVLLKPGSEVSIHPSGKPAFFTLVPGTSLDVQLPSLETVSVFGGDMNASISLDTHGLLEKGVLNQTYVVPRLGYIATRGSGLIYSANPMDSSATPYLSAIRFADAQLVQIDTLRVKVRMLELGLFENIITAVTAEAAAFRPPEDPKQQIELPAGSKITLAKNRKISKIETPSQR